MTKSFYGGSKVIGGAIRELAAKSFSDLVSSYFDVPHRIPVSRAEFHSRPKKNPEGEDDLPASQNELKDGPYICSCTFAEGETHRCDKNARTLVLVCIDIDEADLARPFTESPEALADQLWPFAFVAWNTATSTPELPRLRIVVEIEETPFTGIPEGQTILAKFVRMIANRIGLPKMWKGRTESTTISQPAYRPAVFTDDPKDFSPVICSRPTGKPVQLIDIPNEIEEEIAEQFAYRGETDPDCDLSNLPAFGLTVEDCREPLFAIDPDVDYKTWYEILTSFRHQFREEEAAREAFFLCDEWSRSGSKYRDGDTEAKWKSFRPDSPGRRPVTIATLFHYATQAGWKNTRLAAKYQKNFQQWLATCEDPVLLMDEGPARIAAQPFKNTTTEQAMVSALQDCLAKLGTKVKNTAIFKDVVKARREEKRKLDSDDNLPGWLRPWCFIKTIDKFHNTFNGTELTPEAFNRTYMIEMMPGDKDEDAAKGGRPSIMPSDYALNIKGRIVRKVDGVVYDPRWQGEEPYFEKDGKVFVNAYLASSLPALDEKNSAKAGQWLIDHIKAIIPGTKNQRIMLDWMRFIAQHPGKKCRWVPVLQGAQGCGKTFIANILGAAIGRKNLKLANPGSTSSDFNDWGYGAQVVAIEEIRVKGKNRDEIMNKLKDLTANDQIALNRKHRDVETVDNVTNFIAFTNYHDALYLDEDDRRYFVIKCSIQSKSQKEVLAATMVDGLPYFEHLARLLDMGGAVRHFLLNKPISEKFNPNGDAPDTIFRRQMIEESKNPLHMEIEEMVASGDYPMISRDLVLYEDLKNRTLPLARANHPPSHFLYAMGYEPHKGAERFRVNGSRSQVWVHTEHYATEIFGDPVAELKRRYDSIPDENI